MQSTHTEPCEEGSWVIVRMFDGVIGLSSVYSMATKWGYVVCVMKEWHPTRTTPDGISAKRDCDDIPTQASALWP